MLNRQFTGVDSLLCGRPDRLLLSSGQVGDALLAGNVQRLADGLSRAGIRRIASRLDNGLEWMTLDLAVQAVGGVHVPIPTFFSEQQTRHALADSGAQGVISTMSWSGPPMAGSTATPLPGIESVLWRLPESPEPDLPAGTACVTYTSGSTGQPKGVCLSASTLWAVADSLASAAETIRPRRHLCLMPLSTLLENVAGLYATLLSDAQIALPSLAEIGYTGASGLDVPMLLRCLHRYQPESVILFPQLLMALVTAAEHGVPLPASLRYLAVGGGRVTPTLLARAQSLGLPVFEGYGLTECASVVCLNRPDAQRAGTVGRPLPHASLKVEQGEIVVDGVRALGYLGNEHLPPGPIRTGDLGSIDADGFVTITGRRRNVFITAFGRNVSPEWVESELTAHPLIAQAMVWGEAQADNVAVLILRRPDASDHDIRRALAEVNRGLPDYARVARWICVAQPFSAACGLLTANGRLRREAILARYQARIDECYRTFAPLSSNGVIP